MRRDVIAVTRADGLGGSVGGTKKAFARPPLRRRARLWQGAPPSAAVAQW